MNKLVAELFSNDTERIAKAESRLLKIRNPDSSLITALLPLATSRNFHAWCAAMAILSRFRGRKEIGRYLLRRLRGGDSYEREWAAHALADIPFEGSLNTLTRYANSSKNLKIRAASLGALIKLLRQFPRCKEHVRGIFEKASRSSAAQIRAVGFGGLVEMHDPKYDKRIRKTLCDRDPTIRKVLAPAWTECSG